MKIQITITIKKVKRGYQVRAKEFGTYNNFSTYLEAVEFAEKWKEKFESNETYDYNVCIKNSIIK